MVEKSIQELPELAWAERSLAQVTVKGASHLFGCPSRGQQSSLQETLTLVSAEHPWHKFLAHNPQGAAAWHDRPGVFETQEATDFPHERQAVRGSIPIQCPVELRNRAQSPA
jgi:hypothetical protein